MSIKAKFNKSDGQTDIDKYWAMSNMIFTRPLAA